MFKIEPRVTSWTGWRWWLSIWMGCKSPERSIRATQPEILLAMRSVFRSNLWCCLLLPVCSRCSAASQDGVLLFPLLSFISCLISSVDDRARGELEVRAMALIPFVSVASRLSVNELPSDFFFSPLLKNREKRKSEGTACLLSPTTDTMLVYLNILSNKNWHLPTKLKYEVLWMLDKWMPQVVPPHPERKNTC